MELDLETDRAGLRHTVQLLRCVAVRPADGAAREVEHALRKRIPDDGPMCMTVDRSPHLHENRSRESFAHRARRIEVVRVHRLGDSTLFLPRAVWRCVEFPGQESLGERGLAEEIGELLHPRARFVVEMWLELVDYVLHRRAAAVFTGDDGPGITED